MRIMLRITIECDYLHKRKASEICSVLNTFSNVTKFVTINFAFVFYCFIFSVDDCWKQANLLCFSFEYSEVVAKFDLAKIGCSLILSTRYLCTHIRQI